jgi:hypothetical protein
MEFSTTLKEEIVIRRLSGRGQRHLDLDIEIRRVKGTLRGS